MNVIEYQRQVLRKLGWSEKNILAEEQRQQVQTTKTTKHQKQKKQKKTIDVDVAADAEFWKKRAEYQKKQEAMKDQKKNMSDTELRMERLRGLGQTNEQIERMLANEQHERAMDAEGAERREKLEAMEYVPPTEEERAEEKAWWDEGERQYKMTKGWMASGLDAPSPGMSSFTGKDRKDKKIDELQARLTYYHCMAAAILISLVVAKCA